MRKKILITISSVIAAIAIFAGGVLAVFATSFNKGNYHLIDEELFKNAREVKNTVYLAYDSSGELVEVFNTSRIIGQEWTPLSEVSDYLIKGFISAEDRSFYTHHGVNIKRTLGAIFNYVFHLSSRFGASTITQQVIKNISGNNETSAKRKFNEIMRALRLEQIYTKDEILEVYLNIVPMSGNMYGVARAAEAYFGKTPKELTLAESATLIGITNSPRRYNPYTNHEDCMEKRNRVLYAMLDNGAITDAEYRNAINEPLKTVNREASDNVYSWFIESANADIISDLTREKGITAVAARMLLRGCRIVLTENPEIQEIMEKYFSDLNNFPGECGNGLNYSMTVIDNKTGNLVGVIGGVGCKRANNLLNLAEIKICPASTLKPLAIYAPMIDEGSINWATVIDDTPINVKVEGDKIVGYPANSPNVYNGLTSVNDALRLSKNTVAVKLLHDYGLDRCAGGLVSRYGFDILTSPVEINGRLVTDMAISPLALGQLSRGISIRNLSEAYSAFAREGRYTKARSYIGVFDFDGNLLVQPQMSEKQIYKPTTCRILNQLLMNVVDSGTAKAINLKNHVDTAGKTGTSSGNYDRLFVGYTPYYTAGIWCGYPTRESGIEGVKPTHLQIWDKVMSEIHEECAFEKFGEAGMSFDTSGLELLPFCLDSGMLVGDFCEYDIRGSRVEYGYFDMGNMPDKNCKIHLSLPNQDRLISAPMIEREDVGVDVIDAEYNYSNLVEVRGFEDNLTDIEELSPK